MVIIYVDDRERRTPVLEELKRLGAQIEIKRLEVADYATSTTGIERKTANDFLSSIIDKRLFEQAKYLALAYEKPVIIIEGSIIRALHYRKIGAPQAFGALAALLDMGLNVITTENAKETAWIIFSLARREDRTSKKRYLEPVKIKVKRTNKSVQNTQINLVASIPGISAELAHRILTAFKTPRAFFKASTREMKKVPGLGEKRIRRIIEILDTDYTALGKYLEKEE